MNYRDQRPTPALPSFDPAQLSFGDVEAVPQLRVDRQADAAGGATDSALTYREPPVCGESSFDDVEDAGPSWSVRIVQEAESAPATARARPAPSRPVAPRPAAPAAPAPAPARPASTRTAPTAAKSPTSAALDPLKRSTEMSPRDADAAIAYAHALEKHGDATGALDALDQCLAAGGDELRLICARAFLLGGRLKYEQAEAELKRATKLHPDAPEVRLQAGILACRRARWRDAVEPLREAAAHRADDPLAHFYLGEALNHVDQLPAALQAYERAAQLDPANWRAFKGVGIVLDRLGRPADAAVAYRHMREAQGR